MTKFKLGFLKSSASFTDNTSYPSPKFKRFFTLRRKRNDSQPQRQPLLDVGQGNYRSASPPRTVNPLVEVATDLAATPTISTSSSKQPAELLFHFQQQPSPPAGIQTSRPHQVTGHFELTERVESLHSMEKYTHIFQERSSRGKTSMEITKTQETSDLNSEINLHSGLSYSHSSVSITAPKLSGSLPLSSQPYSARHPHEQRLQIQISEQHYEVSRFHQVLEVLQRAARRVQVDQTVSQASIFRSLVPLAVFLYLFGLSILLPRQQRYRYSQIPEENTSVPKMILLFFIGMSLALVVLRGMVWFVGVLGKAFCEVDLTQIFRRGECVDVDGRGMGEAELIVGGMLM